MPDDEYERKDEEPTTLYVGGEQPAESSGTLLAGDHLVVEAISAPPVFSDPVLPPHIVGKGFHGAKGTWRVVLPSGRVAALNSNYHIVTEHEDGSISIIPLAEFGPFVGKLTRGAWRVDHPEV